VDYYGRAVALREFPSVRAQLGLGQAQRALGDSGAAIATLERALRFPMAATYSWRVHDALGALYRARGDLERAGEHETLALEQAPESEKPALALRRPR
jgi:Flp pilus assembly protein TadD